MEVIQSIINKPKWETKIENPSIVRKWRTELRDQGANLPEKGLDTILELLQQYKSKGEKKYTNYDDKNYDWVAGITVSTDELGFKWHDGSCCDCNCYVCENGREYNESDYEDDPDYYTKKVLAKMKKQSEIPCKCHGIKDVKTKEYLNKIINKETTIDSKTRKSFMNSVRKYQTKHLIDYHPGSGNQVVDIVHPSLYCYTKGVTLTNVKKHLKNESNEHLMATIDEFVPMEDEKILFQWLPAEFHVERNADGTVANVDINSYINNINKSKDPSLYKSIAQIFGKFVPSFDKVLHNIKSMGKIKTYGNLSDCQVIVKIGSTVLTPDDTKFDGGSWHLEGMPAEKIIATGIYYYDMKNIDDHSLDFRVTMDSYGVSYPQNGDTYVERHYGLHEIKGEDHYDTSYDSVMSLGGVKTEQDMCVVFPNFMQHRVSEFNLKNKTKHGNRNILVFFLVDPSQKIMSTTNIPPQQDDDTVMTFDDALFYRELLMFQRKYEIQDQNKFYARGWSLCEH
jgi:hypothetical protein